MTIRHILWGAATLILALIIHFCAVLAIPHVSENDAWKRLYNLTKVNEMLVVDTIEEANRLWAFHAPDMSFALCRYDVTTGPVRVDFELLRGYWSVARYDPDGKNFYAADGFDFLRQETSLLLLGPDHIKGDNDALPINVPTEEGLLVLRAPFDNPVLKDTVNAMLKRSKCDQIQVDTVKPRKNS